MEFTKMQGAGNDFIIINNMKLDIPVEKLSAIANRVCKRRVSIGRLTVSWLLIILREMQILKCVFINSDGTIGEMCGNGARCISRYAYLNNIAGKKMKFETGAGIICSEILENRQVKVPTK